MAYTRIKSFKFIQTNWQESRNEILRVRHRVFMIEQHSPDTDLCDIEDHDCFHLVTKNNQDEIIATGRLTQQGRIGRIAVLLPYRGVGIGTKLFKKLIQIGRANNITNISLNAELGEQQFYHLQKFTSAGPVFMKQGVPYQMLARKLA